MLTRAALLAGVAVGAPPVAGEGGEVGEGRKQAQLGDVGLGVRAGQRRCPVLHIIGDHPPRRGRLDVETEHDGAQQHGRRGSRPAAAVRRAGQSSMMPSPAAASSASPVPAARCATAACRRRPARCGPRTRRAPARSSGAVMAISIFIASTTHEAVAGGDHVAGLRRRRRPRAPRPGRGRCRRRRGRSGGRRRRPRRGGRCPASTRRPERSPADGRAGCALGRGARRRRQRGAVELDWYRAGPPSPTHEPVGLPAVAQLDLARRSRSRAWGRPRAGRVEEAAPARAPAALAGIERGGDEGDVGVARRQSARRRRSSRSSHAGVDVAGAHLGPLEQVEQERLVRRAAAHDHGQSATAPGADGPAPRRGRGRRR